jgi:hypothetical protein
MYWIEEKFLLRLRIEPMKRRIGGRGERCKNKL